VSAAARSGPSPGAGDAVAAARAVLDTVPDPEIPVLSLVDLGIIRSIDVSPDGGLEVGVSPTYSGCPATAVIRADITTALEAAGFAPVRVRDVLSPPWTSDWISADGRRKLEAYGIAPPPAPVASVRAIVTEERSPACPRCGSADTELLSEFGSTPCKALHRCRACLEPFDRFKCI
jgi:ring-1,2-phenylacetyl-CoA epoxidase subunit PaaD